MLTSGGPEVTEEHSGFEIVHMCFVEVGNSVLGVFCLEFLQAKLSVQYELLG